jgi:hypothetical protein
MEIDVFGSASRPALKRCCMATIHIWLYRLMVE